MKLEQPKEIYLKLLDEFHKLETDPVTGPILQQIALHWIMNEDPGRDYNKRELTGMLDSNGHMMLKLPGMGSSGRKPSEHLNKVEGIKEVIRRTKDKIRMRAAIEANKKSS